MSLMNEMEQIETNELQEILDRRKLYIANPRRAITLGEFISQVEAACCAVDTATYLHVTNIINCQ